MRTIVLLLSCLGAAQSLKLATLATSGDSTSTASYCPEMKELYSDVFTKHKPGGNSDKAIQLEKSVPEDVQSWWKDACPWEETRHSGFYLDNPFAQEASSFANDFCPTGERMSTEDLLQHLNGTRLTFIGDSVMRQFSQAVMCQFQKHLVSDQIPWRWWPHAISAQAKTEECHRRPSDDANEQKRNCYMKDGCARFKYDVEVCYKVDYTCGASAIATHLIQGGKSSGASLKVDTEEEDLEGSQMGMATEWGIWFSGGRIGGPGKKGKAAPRPTKTKDLAVPLQEGKPTVHKGPEVLVFSTGHHSKCTAPEWERLKQFKQQVPKDTRIVFQDYSPQHFPEKANGEFGGSVEKECRPSLDEVPSARQLELESAIPAINELGWTHLETYAMNQNAGKFHAAGASNKNDCTHWMMPGVPDVWAKQLYTLL